MKDIILEERRQMAQRFLDVLKTRRVFSKDFEYRGCSIIVCVDDTPPEVLEKILAVDKKYRKKIQHHISNLKKFRYKNA